MLGTVSSVPSVADAYPGVEFVFHPGSASKNLSILTQKMVSKLSEIWSGLFSPDPGSGSWLFTHPGSRGRKGTGSRIRIRKHCLYPYLGFFVGGGEVLGRRRHRRGQHQARPDRQCGQGILPLPVFWARIFKRLWSPGIGSKASIPPAYVAWRAGMIILFLLGA